MSTAHALWACLADATIAVESASNREGGTIVCGIDEAGRGPLAGPVTAAAVILGEPFPDDRLDDSKVVDPRVREELAPLIRGRARAWAVGWAWPEEIDRINIHHATLLAMLRACRGLDLTPGLVLVDGRFTPAVGTPCRAEIDGDARIPEIMAASILAKTARDRWMARYARIDGRYGFESHFGYATRAHRERLRLHGPSTIHRRSFKLS